MNPHELEVGCVDQFEHVRVAERTFQQSEGENIWYLSALVLRISGEAYVV